MKKRLIALLLVLILIVPCAIASSEVYYRLKKTAKIWQFPTYDSRVISTYRADWVLTITKKINKTWAYVTFTNGQDAYLERSLLVRAKTSTAWVSKDKINVRRGPSYNFTTLYTVNRGDKVTVLCKGNSYSYIKTSSGFGYIENGALSKKKVSPSPTSKPDTWKDVNYTAWVISKGGKVGLRSEPSGSQKTVFASYGPGTKITVLKEGKEFNYVSVDGKKGYMRNKYITKHEPATVPTPTPKPEFKPYTAVITPAKAGEKVKVYLGEGLGWSVKMRLTEGTVVTVIKQGKDPYWVKIRTEDGRTGFMQKKFLK